MAVKKNAGPPVKKRRTVSKTSGRRPINKSRTTIKTGVKNPHLVYEIIAMTCLVLSILLILGIYFESAGFVGEVLRHVLFGVFGVGAYLIPAYAFAASILKIFNQNNQRLNNKLVLIFMLIVAIATLTHLIYLDRAQINTKIFGKSTFFPALVNYYSVSLQDQTVGGFVGGLLGDLIAVLLGKVGGILVLSLINISLLILMTEQSLFRFVKWVGGGVHNSSNKVYEKGKGVIDRQKEHAKTRRIEREALKEDKFIKQIEEQEIGDQNRENILKKSDWFHKKSKAESLDPIEKELTDLVPVEEGQNAVEPAAKTADIIETPIAQVIDDHPEAFDEAEDSQILAAQPLEVELPLTSDPAKPIQISFFKESAKIKPEIDISKESPIKGHLAEETINKTLYEYPPLQLLKDNPYSGVKGSTDEIQQNAIKLEQTLDSFGVKAKVVNVSYGPTVTRYELQPEVGVKVSRIVSLSDDIALNLAASGIRMEAPIPGKALIGIEVPNKEVSSVFIKEVIDTPQFQKFPSKIAFALGKDISGETIIADIAKMPHMLISGSTGSGKSVCINTLITSILYRANPNEVKLLMIDPKVVELKVYNGIPHLLIPVVTDPKKAAGALYWAVQEMSERYQLFANANVRDLAGYNRSVEEAGEGKKLPQIVIIVDELADLMQVAAKDVEEAICRLAQMARAAGIHLILATQRPSVDVITGIIKANVPSRIAFMVSSGIDSRTIIDMNGAEKLVGKGDMLYYPVGMPKPLRVQGAFISDKEVESVVEFLKASQKVHYDQTILDRISKDPKAKEESQKAEEGDHDSLFEDALTMVIDMQKASASMIQRRFRVGYNRAARMIDQLHEAGFIGPDEGSKPRTVLLTKEAFDRLKYEAKELDQDQEAQSALVED